MLKNLISLLLIVFLCGCSTKIYQNTTAQYNGYFLAKEKMKEAEKKLFDARKDDFNKPLHVFIPTDTNQQKGMSKDFDLAIKHAAFAIERHPKSKWIDDAYLIVGKSRLYQRDFANATSTLKYLNIKFTEQATRQQALMTLMFLYAERNEFAQAEEVKSLLKKKKIEKENYDDFYLIQAHLYREKKDLERTRKSLELAVPRMKRSEQKGRIYFLLGQIYQQQEKPADAYKNFKKVLKYNPNYELRMQATLGILQNSPENRSEKSIERKLKRTLNDEKNIEFQDVIYNKLADFELKRKKTNDAVEYLLLGAEVSKDANRKSYLFLRIAELNYEKLRKYAIAKSYYDSTMIALPKSEERYEKIAKRTQNLKEFVTHITVFESEDSLQRLAQMPENDRDKYLTDAITKEVKITFAKEKKRKERIKKRENAIPADGGTLASATQSLAAFYFDNIQTVNKGKSDFIKKWGNRPLVDGWRLQSRVSLVNPAEYAQQTPLKNIQPKETSENDLISEKVEKIKKDLISKLPKTTEEKTASLARLEVAMYALGKIYNFQLDEYKEAEIMYQKYLQRFYTAKNAPEVLYLLAMLYKNQKNETAMNEQVMKLNRDFPNSNFTKIWGNPNYMSEQETRNKTIHTIYEQAHTHYRFKEYPEAQAKICELVEKYQDNDISDKIMFMETLCAGKLQHKDIYKMELERFVRTFQRGQLADVARQILAEISKKK